jgi:diketogulonate reductase-like aldo/keto reductase
MYYGFRGKYDIPKKCFSTGYKITLRFIVPNRWRAIEDAYKAGKLRAVGVSNFERQDIDNLLAGCTVQPMVNQLLAHVSNTPFDLIAYSESKGMLVEAYSPVAHGEILKNRAVADMAAGYGVSVPALCIRYTLQLGLAPLPKTANPAHMKDNANVDFTISQADMETLRKLERIHDYGEFSRFPVFGGKSE